jgi:Golgi phosphoprotein 3 (GPP34)
VPETLAEELLLLAYDIRGKCRLGPAELAYGVGGALLSELNLAGLLKVDGTALTAAGDTPTGNPILDGLLEQIETAPRTRTPREWVTRMRATDVQDRLLARMAERGRIEVDRHRAFAGTRYPVRDIVGLWEAQQRVVAAVTTQATAAPRTLALGALVVATGMGKALFATSGNWRTLRARMREMTRADWPAEAVREAIAAEGRGPARVATASR